MSVRADDAVVDMLVAILVATLQTRLTALCVDAGIASLPVAAIGIAYPAALANSIVVRVRKSSRSDKQAVNVGAALRRQGEIEVLINVAGASIPLLDRHRRLWAHAVESVILEHWQEVAYNTASLWQLTAEVETPRRSPPMQSGAGQQNNIEPISVIFSYRQHVTQSVLLA